MSSRRQPSTIFHAVTHVWGREYLDLFLGVCVPNQLSPGNIPALPSGSRYRILTGGGTSRNLKLMMPLPPFVG
jgi:hypothetical protein